MRAAHRSNTFVPRATPRPKGTLRAQLYSVFHIISHFFAKCKWNFADMGGTRFVQTIGCLLKPVGARCARPYPWESNFAFETHPPPLRGPPPSTEGGEGCAVFLNVGRLSCSRRLPNQTNLVGACAARGGVRAFECGE